MTNKMDRKTFIKKSCSAALLIIPSVALLRCSNSELEDISNSQVAPEQAPSCLLNGAKSSKITDNHGHRITVSAEDISAGREKTYDIQGNSGHPHTITVTAQDFLILFSQGEVVVSSTRDEHHAHDVTISCA
jgi:hypothetical protein